MIIKLNYRLLGIFLALLIVGGFWIADLAIEKEPLSFAMGAKTADTPVSEEVRLPVIMYHHLLKDEARRGDYVISPTLFEADLKYIKENGYTTITAAQLLAFIKQGDPLPDKPIMITFDDGYETVYSYAFPLLQKYEMKAIISIIGKHTDIFSQEEEPHHLNYSHVSWDELREMQKSGVFEIENHSYDMHNPRGSERYGSSKTGGESDSGYRDALIKDVGGLSESIEAEIGERPIMFAYPFGAISKAAEPVLTELGFSILLTCEEKVNILKPGQGIPVKLKRFNRAGGYETKEFFMKL